MTSDLIFPELATNFSQTLTALKHSALSISNRLQSIVDDSEFVCTVAEAYRLPLVANERCGSWYIPPERKAASAYFKSTDGHAGQWSMSLRRLNVQILDLVFVLKSSRCVIVDSTRRGKRMPDALSKTVPIWCAVFNRLLFPNVSAAHELHTPPNVVSRSEHSQIEDKLPGFLQQLKSLEIDVTGLQSRLAKPLRPLWVTRDSLLPDEPPDLLDFYPVVLCTASRRVTGGEISEGGYIQGAGDDSEGWACGLTSQVFWKNRDQLLKTPEEQLPSLIPELLIEYKSSQCPPSWAVVRPTSWLYLGSAESVRSIDLVKGDCLIACTEDYDRALAKKLESSIVHLKCRPKKLGSRDLRKQLSKILPLFTPSAGSNIKRLYICCSDGKDISVGVALAILCIFSDCIGNLRSPPPDNHVAANITKQFIQQRLSWVMTSIPNASPSRATLQSVNHFLLSELSTLPVCPTHALPPPSNYSSSNAANIFRSLCGEWSFYRTLLSVDQYSAIDKAPAGTVSGTALFQPRPLDSGEFPEEYLYTERGTLTTPDGTKLAVHRQWIWKLDILEVGKGSHNDRDSMISIYFVKPDGVTLDYLYQKLEFRSSPGAEFQDSGLQGHLAVATHPCGGDVYNSSYRFWIDKEKTGRDSVVKFSIDHDVHGPKKDYTSKTVYEPGEIRIFHA